MSMSVRKLGLLAELSGLLGMSTTDREILALLLRTKKKLYVSEITAWLKRSERAVRGRLGFLHRMGLVRREPVITKRGKRAYRYFTLQTHELIKSAREEMLRRLHRLERRLRRT
ncbi:MAG: HTH domain-containing protein [Candidatus Hadarchaeota archaeon]|nr:HTH domain-containing protein [Candidatus Hadarchaeota archaeon]